MKIAILGDIHANLEALKVAYDTAKKLKVDKIFHLGDLGGYAPFVNEVVDFLVKNKIDGVQGNYDEAVAFDKEDCGCKYEDLFQAQMAHIALEWTKRHVSEKAKRYMKNLPFDRTLEVEGIKIKIFHATPIKNNLYWYEERTEKFFLLMAEKAKADVMIYGHTHIPYFKVINGKYFINAGSVGRPQDNDPRTCVCFLEISKGRIKVDFIRKNYNINRTFQAIIDNGLTYYFAEKMLSAR